MKTKYDECGIFPYHVRLDDPFEWAIYNWCTETFGIDINGVWMILLDGYAFKYEADCNWFVLRWS